MDVDLSLSLTKEASSLPQPQDHQTSYADLAGVLEGEVVLMVVQATEKRALLRGNVLKTSALRMQQAVTPSEQTC